MKTVAQIMSEESKQKKRMHNLVYMARQRGIRIDTSARTIYIGSDDEAEEIHYVRRLRKEHGFVVQIVSDQSRDQRVYISGPIDSKKLNGEPYDIEERKREFEKVERRLRKQGYRPVNPFKNGVDENAHWREHMRKDIRLLTHCDIILLMDGWEYSKGCRLELDVATTIGMKVCYDK